MDHVVQASVAMTVCSSIGVPVSYAPDKDDVNLRVVVRVGLGDGAVDIWIASSLLARTRSQLSIVAAVATVRILLS